MKKMYLLFAGAACFLLAFIFMALDGLTIEIFGMSGGTSTFSLMGDEGGDASIIAILNLIILIAAIALAVLAALCEMKVLKFKSKGLVVAAIVCGLICALLFFLTKTLFVVFNDINDGSDLIHLGVGAILSGIFCILGTGAVAGTYALKK